MPTRTILLLIGVAFVAVFRFVLPYYFPGHQATWRYAIIGALLALIFVGTALQFRRRKS